MSSTVAETLAVLAQLEDDPYIIRAEIVRLDGSPPLLQFARYKGQVTAWNRGEIAAMELSYRGRPAFNRDIIEWIEREDILRRAKDHVIT